jgi:hypothetical protein
LRRIGCVFRLKDCLKGEVSSFYGAQQMAVRLFAPFFGEAPAFSTPIRSRK